MAPTGKRTANLSESEVAKQTEASQVTGFAESLRRTSVWRGYQTPSKCALALMAGLPVLGLANPAHAVCESALVLSTYQLSTSYFSDYRLADQVDEQTWNKISHDVGAQAAIYGVPVGGSYKDFKNSINSLKQSHNESFSTSQFVTIATSGLDSNSPNLYRDCLLAEIFRSDGLHGAIVASTKSDILILVKWFVPNKPTKIAVQWSPAVIEGEHIQQSIPQGLTTVRVPRPKQQLALTGNFEGDTTGPIILDSWPDQLPPPPKKTVASRIFENEKFTVIFNVPSDNQCGVPWNAPGNLLGGIKGADGAYTVWYVRATSSWFANGPVQDYPDCKPYKEPHEDPGSSVNPLSHELMIWGRGFAFDENMVVWDNNMDRFSPGGSTAPAFDPVRRVGHISFN